MTTEKTSTLSDIEKEIVDRNNLKRTCHSKEQNKQSDLDELSDQEDSPEVDDSSDEDFTLNKPKKKSKKKRKISNAKMSQSGRKSLKKKNIIPSFDDVMHAQIQHAQRFIDYDEYDSTDSNSDHSETELQEIVKEEISMKNQPQAQTFEPKEKRKKIVIYPWRPIGITGGRPMDEVNK